MYCSKCGSKNNNAAKFCTDCGKSLKDKNEAGKEIPGFFKDKIKKIKFNKKYLLLAFILGILGFGSYVSAQYYADYSTVKDELNNVSSLMDEGKFEDASNIISTIENEGLWIASWLEDNFENLKKDLEIDLKSDALFDEAITLKDEEKFEESRNKFKEIDINYSLYEKVQKNIDELNEQIENKLKEEADAAAADAAASAAAAERAKQQKAAADAAASAAAREKEEEIAIQQATAFVDETVSIYNSIIKGSDYLTIAFDYDPDDDNFLIYVNRAGTTFSSVQDRSNELYEYRTPTGYEDVPTWLYTSAAYYNESIDYLLEAGIEAFSYNPSSSRIDDLIDEATISYENAIYYRELVSEFLTIAGR